MRKAAGIILITLGALFLLALIYILFIFDLLNLWHYALSSPNYFMPVTGFAFFLGLFVAAAFSITGGIFCLRRKYWRVCLASDSFAVFFLVFEIVFFLVLTPFPLVSSWSDYIYTFWPIWVMLVAAVIAVIFILRTKKEWQVTSDIMDSKASNDG